MKKILLAAVICLLAALTLTACGGKKTEATKAVEAMIGDMGEITIDSADALGKIQEAYNALSAEEKERVKNYDKFEKALETLKAEKQRFASYDEMNAKIAEIVNAAGSTFSKDGTDYSKLIESGNAILEQYGKMSGEEKSHIQMPDDFKSALETLGGYVSGTEAIATEYVKAFYTVYKDQKYEVTNIYCIKQIRNETQFHVFALTYKDAAGAEHTLYANARCSADTKAAAIAENADAFFAEKSVSDDFNAVTNGNVEINVENVLKNAK